MNIHMFKENRSNMNGCRMILSAVLLVFISTGIYTVPVCAQTSSSQTRSQIAATEKKLQDNRNRQKKLDSERKNLQSQLSQLENSKKKNAEKLKELSQKLEQNKKDSAELHKNLDSLEAARKRLSGDFSGVFLLQFRHKTGASDYYGSSDIPKNLLLRGVLLETFSRLDRVNWEKGQAQKKAERVDRAGRTLEDGRVSVQRQQNSVDSRKKGLQKEIGKKEKTKQTLLAEEARLKEAKASLEKLFRAAQAREEEERKKAETAARNSSKNDKSSSTQQKQTVTASSKSSSMPIPSHSLSWPADGSVIEPYSNMMPGVKIAVPQGQTVKAVMAGKVDSVEHSGDVLGRMVLVRHGNGLVTAYGLLEDVRVSKGEAVGAGTVLGRAGKDREEINSRYPGKKFYWFFLLFNGKQLNPSDWLR